MDFPLEKCFVTGQQFSVAQMQKILQYPHVLTCVLLDLGQLEEEVNKIGEERTITGTLSREERDLLGKFTSIKRKREWLGGRFVAKYAAARLLEQVASLKSFMHWSTNSILADENGRPFLSLGKANTIHVPAPDISISHSDSMAAAMAVHKGYCGIDIQKITPKVIKVGERFCTQDEKKILRDFFPLKTEELIGPMTTLWAAKEALRKASNLASLPGFMELKLIEIDAPFNLQSGPWGFIFNWNIPGGLAHKKCRVAVTQIENYALALTARDDTVD